MAETWYLRAARLIRTLDLVYYVSEIFWIFWGPYAPRGEHDTTDR
jgi:hypothetical protein